MNFNRAMLGNFFYSLTNFILALFFLLAGIGCVLVAWFPNLQLAIQRLIHEDFWMIFFSGVAFILIGLAIILNLSLQARRISYTVKSGKNSIEVDQLLIEESLNLYWKQLFPHYSIPTQIRIKNNQVHIKADFPLIAENEQSSFVKELEERISEFFTRTLGYRNDFFLSVSFQEMPHPL